MATPRTSQFGLGLPTAEAYAVCGPAAAIAFAQTYGRNPTVQEAMQMAQGSGWTQAAGMAGPQSEVNLLNKMGVSTHMSNGVDWNAVAQDVQGGNPVIINTPGHYFYVEGYDPQSGKFNFGSSATDLKAAHGQSWFSPDQLPSLGMGAATNAIFADNPLSPQSSVATSLNNIGSGIGAPKVDPNNKDSVVSYIRSAAQARGIDPDIAVAVANQEGLNTYVGDNNSSFGPYQLHYGNVAAGGNAVSGLGDAFTAATGMDARDPSTIAAQIDYSLDQVAQNGWGPWHGAAAIGVYGKTGVGSNAKALGTYSPANAPGSTNQSSLNASIYNVPTSQQNTQSNPLQALFNNMKQQMPWMPDSMIQEALHPSLQTPNYSFASLYPGTQRTPFTPSAMPSASSMMNVWRASDANNNLANINPWQAATPMSYQSNFNFAAPYGAPPTATPNLMSRMSNPGSLYG